MSFVKSLRVKLLIGSVWLTFALQLAHAQSIDEETGPLLGGVLESAPSATVSGDFTHSVPFNVPAFHDIAPSLGLAYSSAQRTPGGGPFGVLSAGWRLTGFSEIRRTSRGGGAPWHDNALDEFRLDGQRLWKCNDPLVFNAASCSVPIANTAHGYTTENESWLRIRRFDGSNQRWEVTQRDGTKRVYKP
ncbi:MAG: hypothetical protein AAF183_24130, partial [Pseudomonadota bacterium]